MTSDDAPTEPFRPRPRVRILQLDPEVLRALGDGDLAAAATASPVPLTPYLTGPDTRWLWALRSSQVSADPGSARWVTGVVQDADTGAVVGRAGFHGPPDADGTVEVGYAVDPAHRRRGYARAALEALLERAAGEPGVRTVRASISPDNAASLALVAPYGFVAVGEQWDERDGPETVLEVPARGSAGRR